MVITVALVGLLASVAFPLTEMTFKRNKEQELRSALWKIREAIDAYKQASDEGRIPKNSGDTGYPKDLDVLAEGVVDARSPGKTRIYFLRRVPRDPFHADASMSAAETWGKRSYASPPDAPEPGDDVYDVYSLATGKGLNGIPYRHW